jgi:hypothetical protein
MRNLAVICIIGVLFSACQKQKNVDEFEQFKGKWKLEKRISYVKDSIFEIDNFIQYNYSDSHDGYTSSYFSTPKLFNTTYPTDLEYTFTNDGKLSFNHPTYGKESFKIKSYESFVFKATINETQLSSASVYYNFKGYWLNVTNWKGQKFRFFFGKDEVRDKLITVIWFKGRNYYSQKNPDIFFPRYYYKNGLTPYVGRKVNYSLTDCYVLGLYARK